MVVSIDVTSIVPQCYTYEDGEAVADAIRTVLRATDTVALSFRGVRDVPSSFVNGAFIGLLDEFTVADIRNGVRVIHSSKQINNLIKDQLQREADRLPASDAGSRPPSVQSV